MIKTRTGGAPIVRRGGVLGGCLVILGIVLVLAIAGGVYVAMNLKTWTANLTVQGIEAALDESDLTEDQKSDIMVHVRDLADDFKAGDVTWQEMANIGEEIASSPVLPVAAVYGARRAYFNESGLSDEEKANADLQMQRLARGVFEKKISMTELEDACDQIVVRTSSDEWHLKEPDVVDDEDLREMVGKITALVQEKEIPNEPFEVDIAAEIKAAIDRGRGLAPPLDESAEAPEDGDMDENGEGAEGDGGDDGGEGDEGGEGGDDEGGEGGGG